LDKFDKYKERYKKLVCLCGLKENDRESHTGGQAINREMYIPCKKRERDLLIFRYKKERW